MRDVGGAKADERARRDKADVEWDFLWEVRILQTVNAK